METLPSNEKRLLSVKGTKIGLGPVLPEHQELLTSGRQDPEIAVYYSAAFFPASTPIVTNVFSPTGGPQSQSSAITSTVVQANSNVISFTIYELETFLALGQTSLSALDYRNDTANFSIEIVRKEFWGKGYGTEATQLMLEYGFRFLNMHTISLQVYAFNKRAIRAYQKVGFQETGRRREAIYLSGVRYDVIYMDCLNSEFKPSKHNWFTL